MVDNNYSSDSPVSTQEEDRFSRWIFSERIAQVISRNRLFERITTNVLCKQAGLESKF
jgi:hypothetical protein